MTPRQADNLPSHPEGASPTAEMASFGERLLPYLFGAMEACLLSVLLVGLAHVNIFEPGVPLMPLWAPFVLSASALWLLFQIQSTRPTASATKQAPGTALVLSVAPAPSALYARWRARLLSIGTSMLLVSALSLVTALVVWTSVYNSIALPYDPRWLDVLLSDIRQLDSRFYYVVSLVIVACFLYWRSSRLLHLGTDPAYVFRLVRIGVGIVFVILVARVIPMVLNGPSSIVFHDGPAFILLLPLFLFLVLATHGLAQAIYTRRFNFANLEGSIIVQERSIALYTGIVGAAFVVITTFVASGGLPAPIARFLSGIYTWLLGVLPSVIAFLLAPLTWLLSLFPRGARVGPQAPPPPCLRPALLKLPKGTSIHTTTPCIRHSAPPTTFPYIPLAGVIMLTILALLALYLLVRLVIVLACWFMDIRRLRRARRIRLVTNGRGHGETRESLWSWALFWSQLGALVRALFARLFPWRTRRIEERTIDAEEGRSEPTVRSVREIYRAMLKRAARHGYPRLKNETPYEYRQRLEEKTPLAEPRIVVITELYIAIRYGGIVPHQDEVERIRQVWLELEKKWQEIPT